MMGGMKKKPDDFVDVRVQLGRPLAMYLAMKASEQGITPEVLMLEALEDELNATYIPWASTDGKTGYTRVVNR